MTRGLRRSRAVGAARVVVVGAGISGLCCAIRLLEAGFDVAVVAADPPERTASAVAGAVWFPYSVGPADRVGRWGAATYAELERLAAAEPAAAVSMVDLTVLHLDPPPGPPWWAAALPPGRTRAAAPAELPAGYAAATAARVPFCDAPRHLRWLAGRVTALGGTLESARVDDLAALAARAGLVVDCAGVGARALAGDDDVAPLLGQVVHVRPRPGARLRHIVIDDEHGDDLAYVLPRADHCVLGGTAVAGTWDTAVPDDVAREIRVRCERIAPGLAGARTLRTAGGLRPARPTVRLEAEALPDGSTVIHDYGHGGAGYTLCWGCADDVVALARDHAA
jgi:D-amino-acid oxidase